MTTAATGSNRKGGGKRGRPRLPPVDFAAAVARGETDVAMARLFDANVKTIAEWRDLPEVLAAVEEIRKEAHAAAFLELRSLAGPAVRQLKARLAEEECQACGRGRMDDKNFLKASEVVFDRVGFPRVKAIEITGPGTPEGAMTDQDLEAGIIDEAILVCRLRDRHDLAEALQAMLRGAPIPVTVTALPGPAPVLS